LLTYQSALSQVPAGEKLSILLANGFSQAWDSTIFNYSSLLGAASFGNRDTEIKSLFQQANTYDFEAIMKQLVSAQIVLESYGGDPYLIQQIKEDQETLKEALVSAIASTHPNLPGEITEDEFVKVRNFLSKYRNVFSVNYDLLLYWAINKFDLDPQGYQVDDGFRYPTTWCASGTNQNLFFLHGGLHLYEDGSSIRKHSCTQDGLTIIDQVHHNLNQQKFPIFVSEPDDSRKKYRINHNPYLNNAFNKLGELEGVLFIHGHSIDENDKHIFEKITESNIKKVYVSIFGDKNSQTNKRTKANSLSYIQTVKIAVDFYQAESAPVWT